MCLLFLKPDCTMILSAIARLSQCTKNVAIEETTAVTVKVKKKMINQKKKTAERGRNTEANIIFFSNTDFSSLCLLITLKWKKSEWKQEEKILTNKQIQYRRTFAIYPFLPLFFPPPPPLCPPVFSTPPFFRFPNSQFLLFSQSYF